MKDPDIDERDTARLSTRSDVPPEMLRALQALKGEAPSRRTLDVVASRLGNLLDAPPPAAQPAKWLWRGLGARAVAVRVGIAALTIGTAAVWLRPPARQQAESARTPSGVDAQHGAPSATVAPSAAAPSTVPASAQAALPEAEPPVQGSTNSTDFRVAGRSRSLDVSGTAVAASTDRAASRGRSRRTRGASSTGRATVQPVGESTSSSVDRQGPAAVVAPERSAPQGLPLPAHAEVVGPTPDAGVAREVAEAPAVRQPSEVELMLAARRLAGRDPRAAQRLLEQHAARFPKGVLAPEREVLAIEVLRALGQTAEAEQRLQLFRAQYPNSMHLRRLSASPATPGR